MLSQKAPSPSLAQGSDFKRATYYLRPDQIMALRLLSVLEDRNLSAVVREALDKYLEEHA
jgi:hypothetical protein